MRGTAISLQASTKSRTSWKETVKAAGAVVVSPGTWALTDPLAVTIYYFPEGEMPGDSDNIVKPILDAMCQFIYVDDQQVERVVMQTFEPDRVFAFSDPSPVLVDAIAESGATVYVRISDDPFEELR